MEVATRTDVYEIVHIAYPKGMVCIAAGISAKGSAKVLEERLSGTPRLPPQTSARPSPPPPTPPPPPPPAPPSPKDSTTICLKRTHTPCAQHHLFYLEIKMKMTRKKRKEREKRSEKRKQSFLCGISATRACVCVCVFAGTCCSVLSPVTRQDEARHHFWMAVWHCFVSLRSPTGRRLLDGSTTLQIIFKTLSIFSIKSFQLFVKISVTLVDVINVCVVVVRTTAAKVLSFLVLLF